MVFPLEHDQFEPPRLWRLIGSSAGSVSAPMRASPRSIGAGLISARLCLASSATVNSPNRSSGGDDLGQVRPSTGSLQDLVIDHPDPPQRDHDFLGSTFPGLRLGLLPVLGPFVLDSVTCMPFCFGLPITLGLVRCRSARVA